MSGLPTLGMCISHHTYCKKNKAVIELVQHRFARMLPAGFKQIPYEQRFHLLELWTLEERRNRADLLLVNFSDVQRNECSYPQDMSHESPLGGWNISIVTTRSIWHSSVADFIAFWKISVAKMRILWRHLPTELQNVCAL